MRENRFERNMRKIIPINPCRDNKGFYFVYCDFPHHPGIVGAKRLERERCFEKQCNYLRVYR